MTIWLTEMKHWAPAGLFDLDRVDHETAEIVYLGLMQHLAGRGLGKWLLPEAIATAFSADVRRVVLKTRTRDHPAARTGNLPEGRLAGRRRCSDGNSASDAGSEGGDPASLIAYSSAHVSLTVHSHVYLLHGMLFSPAGCR
ncbi:GNAT family N-acetyltransferase [Mesorhizobium sp. LNJC384A00]|uniref:GNAT family N-acetyltransferase n=1 Tax=Mesorhizobium sp. LNJC384A00 TaxID=1287268 RepID=UPI0012EB54DF|nr:GNAT family N-acetyltransferase [Mesorhizobium sp. LNJC384A00]